MKIACLITALVLGAATQIPVTPAAAQTAPRQQTAPRFDLDTPLVRLAADARGRAVLQRHVPSLVGSPHFPMFRDQSLRQLSSSPHAQVLTPQVLASIETELRAIR